MNIMILIRRFDFGGAENYVRELANALCENGHSVFVLSTGGRQRPLLSPRVTFISIRFSKILLPFNLVSLFFLTGKYHIDVIHANQRSAILAGSLLARLAGIPLVVTIHSTTPLELRSGMTRRAPARIIYINRHTMERSRWYSTLEYKCRFIPNGIQIQAYSPPPEEKRVLYCSRIDTPHAGLLRILIEHVIPSLKAKFSDITLEIIGDGPMSKEVGHSAEAVNRLLGAGTVILRGFRERFVTEGFLVLGVGRVALEALGCGIPVISVNECRCGSRVSRDTFMTLQNTNFVDVTAQKPDAKRLIDEITEILVHYPSALADSRYLRKKVSAELSLPAMVQKIEQVYREAIRETSRAKLKQNRFPPLRYGMKEAGL